MEESLKQNLLKAQKNEITQHYIYKKIAYSLSEKNRKVVLHVANHELEHYNLLKKYTKEDVSPNMFKMWLYYFLSKIIGITFGLKLMEHGEEHAHVSYKKISLEIPKLMKILQDEKQHEDELLELLDEEKLKYMGSIVLGLNDALVELVGVLAGLTLALQNTKLIAVVGLITGISASLSMATSEYLSTKSEKVNGKYPLKASVYTGITYTFTVLFLIFPYLILNSIYFSLAWTLLNALILIALFTYYVSIARNLRFKREFWEMAIISFVVAAISFGIGYIVKILFGIKS